MTRIQGLDGMVEAPPLNVTELVEAARAASVASRARVAAPEPEPVYEGPREGSAAWQAEQVALGNVEIKTRPVSRDFAQGAFDGVASKKTGWGAATREVWDRLGIARLLIVVAVVGSVAYGFLTGGAPSADEVSEAFVEIPGYQYQTFSGIEASLEGLPGLEREVSAVEARGVVRNGLPAGAVMIAGSDPSETTAAKLSAQIDRHVPSAHIVVLGKGQKKITGYEFMVGSAVEVVFVDEDGFLVVVAGLNSGHVHRIATAIGVGNL